MQSECAALREELRRVEEGEAEAAQLKELQELEEDLLDRITIFKHQCQHLAQDLATAKRSRLLAETSQQGALDETRRMMTAHQEAASRRATAPAVFGSLSDDREDYLDYPPVRTDDGGCDLDATVPVEMDPAIVALAVAVKEVRGRAAETLSQRRGTERECAALEADVRRTQAKVAAERDAAVRGRQAAQREELEEARRRLEQSLRRAALAEEDVRRAEGAASNAEALALEQEKFLRGKLEELYAAIRALGRGGSAELGTGTAPAPRRPQTVPSLHGLIPSADPAALKSGPVPAAQGHGYAYGPPPRG